MSDNVPETDTCEMCNTDHTVSKRATVSLFKPNGKWYTDECWTIPTTIPWNTGQRNVLGPFDMAHSPDAHWDGPVYVHEQEPWGYPHLLTGKAESSRLTENVDRCCETRPE